MPTEEGMTGPEDTAFGLKEGERAAFHAIINRYFADCALQLKNGFSRDEAYAELFSMSE